VYGHVAKRTVELSNECCAYCWALPYGAEPFLYVEGSSSRVDNIDPAADVSDLFPKFAAVSDRRRVVGRCR